MPEELEKAYLDQAAVIKQTHAETLADLTWAIVWQGIDSGFSLRSPDSTDVILANALFASVPAAEAGRTPQLANLTPGSYRNARALLDEIDAYLTTLA